MGRRTLVLIVALLLAGVAAFAVYRFLTGVQNERIAQTEFVEVYRAGNRIEAGTGGDLVIQNDAVLGEEVAELLPPTAVAPTAEALQGALGGKVAAGPIPQGAILTTDMWVDQSAAPVPLSEVIEGGNQALTVQVDASQGVAGFIEPGDFVNVLVTLKVEGTPRQDATDIDPQQESGQGQSDTVTKTLTRYVLFNKRVLAIDDQVVPALGEDSATVSAPELTPTDDGSATTPTAPASGAAGQELTERQQLVTLEVTAEEAEQLVFSVEAGGIWLTLATDDFQPEDTGGVVIDSLFGDNPGVLAEYFELP